MYRLLTVVLCVLGAVRADDDPPPQFRLPDTVWPVAYRVRLEPDLDHNTLSGTVIIDLRTTTNTSDVLDSITLNLGPDSSLVEDSVTLVNMKGTILQHLSVIYDNDAQTVQINLPDGQVMDNDQMYVLTTQFQSPLYTSPIGLFTGFFNSTSKYVATSLRATFARSVFPCFDEPQIQVPITLQVVRPSDYKAVSTAKLVSSDPVTNGVLDTFEPTPAISASALGLFISQLDPVTAMGVNVYVASGNNATSQWINDLLPLVTKRLGSGGYTVQTLNLVVLPDQPARSFSSFGFVFTTPEVFYNEIKAFVRANALQTQFTEALLHQWLAYAKTPVWWSHLWLTDSIAAYLAKQLLPQVPVLDYEATTVRSNGINVQTPVVAPLLAPLDIETAIAQQTIRNKGLSVLNMWRDTLPDPALDETISQYLASKQTLTSTMDFLGFLDANIRANSSYDVTPAIDELASWLWGEGTPFVTASVISGTGYTVSQSVGCPGSSNDTTRWPVSISFTQSASKQWTNYQQGLWLIDSSLSVPASQDSWTILNLESAPYRTNYAALSQVMTAVSEVDTTVPVSVRAGIQDDVIALAMGGCVSWSDALYTLNSTQHAQADWLVVTRALDTVGALFGNDNWGLREWQMYAATLFSPELFEQVDLRNTSAHTDQWYARSLVTPWLCKLNLGTCQEAVNALFQPTLDGSSTIDPNDLDNVVCLGARYSPSVVERLLTDYTTATSLETRRLFTIALSCLTESTSVQTVLSNITLLSARDARDVLVGLASSVENFNAVQDFIVAQGPNLEQNVLGSGFLADVIKTLGQYRIPVSKLALLLEDETLELGWYVKQSIAQTSARTDSNVAWFSAHGQSLEQALPQLPATTLPPPTAAPTAAPTAPPQPITTSKPSSATSLMDLRVFSLILSAAVSLIFRSL